MPPSLRHSVDSGRLRSIDFCHRLLGGGDWGEDHGSGEPARVWGVCSTPAGGEDLCFELCDEEPTCTWS